MATEYIAPFFAIIGVVTVWILAQFSAWYKGKKEDNRIRKQVLFNLLEIDNLLDKMTVLSVPQLGVFADKLIQMIPEIENTAANKAEIQQMMTAVYTPYFKAIFTEQLKEIDITYKASVLALAPVDPLIAYQLNGRTASLEKVGRLIEHLTAQIPGSAETDLSFKQIEKILSGILEQKVYTDTIKEIKQLTIQLSSKIGRHTKKKVEKILLKPIITVPGDDEEMSEYVRYVINQSKNTTDLS